MKFARKFKKILALFFILIWTHVDLCIAASALKSSPYSWDVTASGTSVTPEGVEHLFDRNISTSYAPSETVLIDVNLETVQQISEIRIYGASSYTLTVQEIANGQQQYIKELKNLKLSALGERWNRYELKEPAETDTLRFQLVPAVTGGNIRGIKEIEIWSVGEHVPVHSGQVLLSLTDAGVDVEQGRTYEAEPESGVIGPEEGEYADADNDNIFRFDLAYHPAQIKQAYLSYDLSGLAHWTGVIRSINDQPAMGGYVIDTATAECRWNSSVPHGCGRVKTASVLFRFPIMRHT